MRITKFSRTVTVTKSVKVGKQYGEIQLVYPQLLLEESVRQCGSSRDVVRNEPRQYFEIVHEIFYNALLLWKSSSGGQT